MNKELTTLGKSKIKYNSSTYLDNLFISQIAYFESCLFLDTEISKSLLFDIEEIISVDSYGLDIHYIEGKDYIVKDNKLIRLSNGRIPVIKENVYYQDKPNPMANVRLLKGGYISFGEKDTYTKYQILVTYRHKSIWNGPIPICQIDKLKNLYKKINKLEELTILFYGDSITYGCNASGTLEGNNTLPYTKRWPELVTGELEKIFNTKINYINTAVGGMNTKWGLDNVEDRVNKYHPDLVFIGFGMNDLYLSNDEYKSLILEMIKKIRKANHQVEIVLISSILPNNETEWINFSPKNYHLALNSINLPYVAHVDITSIHEHMLFRKLYRDTTGNNINHPNDYLIRIYALAILLTILDKYPLD